MRIRSAFTLAVALLSLGLGFPDGSNCWQLDVNIYFLIPVKLYSILRLTPGVFLDSVLICNEPHHSLVIFLISNLNDIVLTLPNEPDLGDQMCCSLHTH